MCRLIVAECSHSREKTFGTTFRADARRTVAIKTSAVAICSLPVHDMPSWLSGSRKGASLSSMLPSTGVKQCDFTG